MSTTIKNLAYAPVRSSQISYRLKKNLIAERRACSRIRKNPNSIMLTNVYLIIY